MGFCFEKGLGKIGVKKCLEKTWRISNFSLSESASNVRNFTHLAKIESNVYQNREIENFGTISKENWKVKVVIKLDIL